MPTTSSESIWAKQIGTQSYDSGYSVAIDNKNHVIAAGVYSGKLDLDGNGTPELTTKNNRDNYIIKYNDDGTVGWAKSLAVNTNITYRPQVATDSKGAVIATGTFSGNLDIDGNGTADLTSQGIEDVYTIKYNSDGKVAWAKRLGGNGYDISQDITTDSAGNIITTGQFSGKVDINGDGKPDLTSGSTDVFITKYNSDGTLAWAKSIAGTSNFAADVATDSAGNIVTTGTFSHSIDFNSNGTPGFTKTGAFGDMFIAQYNSNGTLNWAKQLGGSAYEAGTSITTDKAGNVIAAGLFRQGNLDLDEDGTFDFKGTGAYDSFITKYNSTGKLIWSQHLTTTPTSSNPVGGFGNYSVINSLTTDSAGNMIAVGDFSGNLDLDHNGTADLSTTGFPDAFIAKYQSDGTLAWAKKLGGNVREQGGDVSVDSQGNVVITGESASPKIDLNGNVIPGFAGAGDSDAFVIKLSGASGELMSVPSPAPVPVPAPTPTPVQPSILPTVDGTGGNDVLKGTNGNEKIRGLGGNDQIFGFAGFDILIGGDGNDSMFGGGGTDSLLGDAGNDWVSGDRGNDTINGDKGHDLLYGGHDNDFLLGGAGNDSLSGDLGRDTLNGGSGVDTFVLRVKTASPTLAQADTIQDFEIGVDKFLLTANVKFSELSLVQSGNNTVMSINGTNQVLGVVSGINPSDLNTSTFITVPSFNGFS